MTQEEKAKAYDKVSKEVKDFFEGRQKMYSNVNQALEYLFPELKKSKDEKMKNWILDELRLSYQCAAGDRERCEELLKAIAWLEKQSNSLPIWKYKKDNKPLLHDSLILNKYGCVAKSPSGAIVSDVWVIDYDELAKLPKEKLEKQGDNPYID